MEKLEKEKLINAWIIYQNAEKNSMGYEENFWAADRLMDLEFEDPELLWELILDILKKNQTERIMVNLAAGPLEGLLAHNGEKFIDRVEEEARKNLDFKRLLSGVWQNLMEPEIWNRVQGAADYKKRRKA